MTFKKLIDKYFDKDDVEQFDCLINKVDCLVEGVRDMHPEIAEEFLVKIDLILNPHFTKETAKYAVSKMKNKDGSTGEHWDYETTSRVLKARGYEFDVNDWYYVLSMIYSDYYKQGRSDDTYIELACDFINDKDGPEDKAKKYFLTMK